MAGLASEVAKEAAVVRAVAARSAAAGKATVAAEEG